MNWSLLSTHDMLTVTEVTLLKQGLVSERVEVVFLSSCGLLDSEKERHNG